MPIVLRRSFLCAIHHFKYKNFRCINRIKYRVPRHFSSSGLLHTIPDALQTSVCDIASSNDRNNSGTFMEPRAVFNRVINEAYFNLESDALVQPKITTEEVSSGNVNASKLWVTTISMSWPEPFEVQGVATRKTESEKLAYLDACEKLKNYGCIDEKNNPIISHKYCTFLNQTLKNPKSDIGNIFHIVWTTFGNQNLIPKYESSSIPGAVSNTSVWKATLKLQYPEEKTFQGISCRLSSAEKIAASKALLWLYEKGVINKKKTPLLFSSGTVKEMYEYQKQPYPLHIPPDLCSDMKSIIDAHENLKKVYKDFFKQLSESSALEPICNESEECSLHHPLKNQGIINVFTEQPYTKLDESTAAERNMQLFNHQNSFVLKFQNLMSKRKALPIFKHREEILKLVNENQVVVISGETGSGKSTQVPQYIMEKFINENKGSECNIVVTQPRRISAIALSQYVAAELGEDIGCNVGYQVRLSKSLPQGNGSILFCTTGILLRKMCLNEKLEGVSHVIIDEVHERNIQIDFLMILMKRLLEENKNLKLILMSATFNTFLFSQYFNTCPIIHISGHLYPVTEYFLDDISNIAEKFQSNCMHIDFNLISQTIAHVDETQPPGAILCFLPGWYEIKSVQHHLNELYEGERSKKVMFCLLHSRLLPQEQAQIFVKPPTGVRKIILSTNIAETSITVEDVVYVIDSGFHKGTSFDEETGITSLGMKWITKANVRQRRGRAGRVQPGVCYHLYTRKVFSHMDDYPVPEILRTPLEKVVLDCKVYCPAMKAEQFLSLAMQPPPLASVQFGVRELEGLGILDSDENLTHLGNIVKYFATHPRLSKALVLASFLRCLDPILTISAFLTITQDPFLGMLEQKKDIQEIKKKFDLDRYSDHLALCELYNKWDSIEDADAKKTFEEAYQLDSSSFQFMKQLKGLFLENLSEAGLFQESSLDAYSSNAHHIPLVYAALTGAFYPNVIKLLQGAVNHGKLDKNAVVYSLLGNQKAFIQEESVAARQHDLPTPWLIYYSGMQSEARRLIMTAAVTNVSALHFLLFAGQELLLQMDEKSRDSEKAVLTLDSQAKLRFSASRLEADLLLQWRQMIQEHFQAFLTLPIFAHHYCNRNLIEFCDSNVLPVLTKVLQVPQVPFSPGLKFEFVDGKLNSSVI